MLVDGMTYEEVRYNVYAFSQDVKRLSRKYQRARYDHTKARYRRECEEAQTYLANNQRRLRQFE